MFGTLLATMSVALLQAKYCHTPSYLVCTVLGHMLGGEVPIDFDIMTAPPAIAEFPVNSDVVSDTSAFEAAIAPAKYLAPLLRNLQAEI